MAFTAYRGGSVQLSIFQNVLLSESMMLIPALMIATVSGSEVGEVFRFKKIRPATVFLVILFVICVEPLVSAVNAFSLLFSDNAAVDIANQYINEDIPFMYVALIIGIIGPLAEEIAFRGIIYAGFRRSGRILSAIVLQAFLFGLMHLNLNQFSYTFLLGTLFGILNEVTMSLWPGIIGHIMINMGGVAGTYALMNYMPDALNTEMTREEIVSAMLFYGSAAILFTVAAFFILLAIARHETGGRFRLSRIFHPRELKIINENGDTEVIKKPHVLTVSVIAGIIIALAEMILPMVLQF